MRSVLVTGAGGSIGSALCERFVKAGVERLTLVSLTEAGLYNIERKLRAIAPAAELVPVLGSVCDGDLMREACEGVDVVVHAAAHKHVPICEANPLAAIENNVRGTLTLANAAETARVGQFLLVSTDKAVKPASVMGATKRAAEMIVDTKARRSPDTVFAIVRFGNVLDSAGSVMPLWREQIANGGPLTLTDERCERYFMSIADACTLILAVIEMRRPGTFVFDMGLPERLIDVAQRLIVASGMPCEIRCIGLRPGEKLTEELHSGGEVRKTEQAKILEVAGDGAPDWRRTMLDEVLAASACRNKAAALGLLRAMTA